MRGAPPDSQMEGSMTPRTFERLCLLLAPLPSSAPWTEGSEIAYEVGLDGIDDADIMQAVKRCLRSSRFRPSVCEIIEAMGPPPVDADALYADVMALVKRYGRYGREVEGVFYEGDPPYPSEAVRQAVLGLGGWDCVCEWSSGEAALRNALAASAQGQTRRGVEAARQSVGRRIGGGLTQIGGASSER